MTDPATQLRRAVEAGDVEGARRAHDQLREQSSQELIDSITAAIQDGQYDEARASLDTLSETYEQDKINGLQRVMKALKARQEDAVSFEEQQTLSQFVRSVSNLQLTRSKFILESKTFLDAPEEQRQEQVLNAATETKQTEETAQQQQSDTDPIIEETSLPPEIELLSVELAAESIEVGTTTMLTVVIGNVGDEPAENVELTLSATGGISLDQTNHSIGTIGGDEDASREIDVTAAQAGSATITVESTSDNTSSSTDEVVLSSSEPDTVQMTIESQITDANNNLINDRIVFYEITKVATKQVVATGDTNTGEFAISQEFDRGSEYNVTANADGYNQGKDRFVADDSGGTKSVNIVLDSTETDTSGITVETTASRGSPGSEAAISVTVTNEMDQAATSGAVNLDTESLPTGVTITSISGDGSSAVSQGAAFFLSGMEPGASKSVTYTLAVDSDVAPGEYDVEIKGNAGEADQTVKETLTISVADGPNNAQEAIANSDGEPAMSFTDVLSAIKAFNDGEEISGYNIGFQDVLTAIGQFNNGN